MSGPLNRVPLGLLSLLELKVPAGRYPVQLGDQILPQLSMEKFYRPQAHRAGLATTAAGAIVGPNRFIPFTVGTPTVVPQGEIWFLAEFQVEVLLQSDQALTFAPVIAIFVGTQAQPYRVGDWHTFGVGTATGTLSQLGQATARYGMPRIIGPGSQLGLSVSGFTPGAVLNATANASFHRLVLTV